MQVMKMVLEEARPSLKMLPYDTPTQYVELITACWHPDPHARPHFKQVSSSIRYCWIVKLYHSETQPLMQARFYVGQMPPDHGLAPKCDMKHGLTNSKYQHIGAISQNAFTTGAPPHTPLGISCRSPDLLVGWGGNTRHSRLNFQRAMSAQICFSRTAPALMSVELQTVDCCVDL